MVKVKEERENVGLKLNIQKTKIMVSGAITSWQIDGNTRPPYLSPVKPVCGVKKQQLEPDKEQWTGSKL